MASNNHAFNNHASPASADAPLDTNGARLTVENLLAMFHDLATILQAQQGSIAALQESLQTLATTQNETNKMNERRFAQQESINKMNERRFAQQESQMNDMQAQIDSQRYEMGLLRAQVNLLQGQIDGAASAGSDVHVVEK